MNVMWLIKHMSMNMIILICQYCIRGNRKLSILATCNNTVIHSCSTGHNDISTIHVNTVS